MRVVIANYWQRERLEVTSGRSPTGAKYIGMKASEVILATENDGKWCISDLNASNRSNPNLLLKGSAGAGKIATSRGKQT